MNNEKIRADKTLFERGFFRSRSAAAAAIQKGTVNADGVTIKKPSELISAEAKIELTGDEPYVGRGGEKLEGALKAFQADVTGDIAIDIGSSTGGFTQCLLRRGAQKVYAIDVGTDQFAAELKNDPRIVLMEKTDIRKVESLPELADVAVIDVSFISLTEVLASALRLLTPSGSIIALVKPQFETEPNAKNKQGVVKNEQNHQRALERIREFCAKNSIEVVAQSKSLITGGFGNAEFFLLLQRNAPEIA